MSDTIKILKKHLEKPLTDHIVFSLHEENAHHIRFSNNEVNRENSKKRVTTLVVDIGYEGRIGNYTTNNLTEEGINNAIKSAFETAKLLPKDPEYMPPVTKLEADEAKLYKVEHHIMDDKEKYKILTDSFTELKNNSLNSAGLLSTVKLESRTLNNAGVDLSHINHTCKFNITAMTKNSSYKNSYIGSNLQDLPRSQFINDLIERTKLSENPKPMPADKYTVILSPAALGELCLFLLWYNFDAKAIDEKRTAFYPRLGKTIADEKIHIYSDPHHPKLLSFPFDPKEGRPLAKFDIIKNGKFVTPSYSRFYEKQKGIETKGLSPANIIVEGGNHSEKDLIKSIENGLYVSSFWYIRLVDLMDGIFTGMTRDGLFQIKNGEFVGSVNNFRFNQNVFDMFMNIKELGPQARTTYGLFPYAVIKDFNFVSNTEF